VDAPSHQPLLHSVGEDVAESANHRVVVEDGLCRVPPLPEASAPRDEPSDFLGRVCQQVLHEVRQIALRRAHEQMQMVRGDDVPEHLHSVKCDRPGKRSPDERIRLLGGAQQKSRLLAARRHEIVPTWLQVPHRSSHFFPHHGKDVDGAFLEPIR
jgi:hypothetical protein